MPYVGLLHDFAVTEHHIVFFVVPLAIDYEQMKRGGIHWSWDKDKKTYLGFLRRYGDGKDVRWIEGPARSATHTMGAFERQRQDLHRHGSDRGQPVSVHAEPRRFTARFRSGRKLPAPSLANLGGRNKGYAVESLVPLSMPLPRQDDRYNSAHYRYGFGACPDPNAGSGQKAGACLARIDIQTRAFKLWNAGTRVALAEPVFAPKSPTSREGEGYLLAVAYHLDQNLRSDLVILDAERIEEGPLATVKLPVQASPQVHGLWVRGGSVSHLIRACVGPASGIPELRVAGRAGSRQYLRRAARRGHRKTESFRAQIAAADKKIIPHGGITRGLRSLSCVIVSPKRCAGACLVCVRWIRAPGWASSETTGCGN